MWGAGKPVRRAARPNGCVGARVRETACIDDSRGQGADRPTVLTPCFGLAPGEGFEPPAKRLTAACSTTELPGIRAAGRRGAAGYSKAVRRCKGGFVFRSQAKVLTMPRPIGRTTASWESIDRPRGAPQGGPQIP